MAEFKHTPGPWKAHIDYPLGPYEGHSIKATNEVETPITFLWVGGGLRGKERQLANAHLIATAPELLKELIFLMSRSHVIEHLTYDDETRIAETIERALGESKISV